MSKSITGDRLKELRLQLKLTQEQVAQKIGIQRVTYLKYENGDLAPVRKLKKLADFFNVSVDYLIGKDDKPPSYVVINNLSRDEEQVVDVYRQIPQDKRKSVISMLKIYADAFDEQPLASPT